MSTLAPPRIVVADASVLINFANIDRFDLVGNLPGYEFVVPKEVEAEITWPTQAARLTAAVASGFLRIETSTDLAEISLASAIRQSLDIGEAASLAMAQHRGWWVACDERGRFVTEATNRIGSQRVVNTAGLVVRAVKAGLLTITEADVFLVILKANRFDPKITSFADLL